MEVNIVYMDWSFSNLTYSCAEDQTIAVSDISMCIEF